MAASKGKNRAKNALALAAWIFVCFLAPAAGSGSGPGEWYAHLNKPPWNPPNWVFGPVWTTLYIVMAIAAWRVWREVGFRGGAAALGLFLLQLALNAAWTPLFFGMHRIGLAFAEILCLWLAIAGTIVAFARHDRAAAIMLLPYLAWVSFASFLNFTLWRLNP